MASLKDRFGSLFQRERVKPTVEQGVAGFAVYGGYVHAKDYNPSLYGYNRWRKVEDILATVSVVASGLRFMSNLVSRPGWSWEPADDSPAAKEAAEFMESVLEDLDTSWTRIVRRSVMFKFHGYMAQEWIAKRREDGAIGLKAIEVRPQHTITKWDVDEAGQILGLVQSDPQTGRELYLPRGKLVYLVDDTLTDRPDGMGWYHHMVDSADRLKSLLDLESIGFERDLRGIPVGRVPFQEINRMVTDNKLTQAQADEMVAGMREFVAMQRKTSNSGMVLDSKPYESKSDTGINPTSVMQWGLELLTGNPGSIEELGAAVERFEFNMALLMGTEVMLTGRGGEGSRALSEDKSRNLYLSANAILWDLAEAVDRDIRDPIWAMNGFPDELKPKANVEDVSYKDAQMISQVLADMAQAGAVLAPDDPAIDDLRQLLGISEAKPLDSAMIAAMNGKPDPAGDPDDDGGDGDDPNASDEVAAEAAANKAVGRSLYMRRNLTAQSATAFIDWAKAQGFATTTPADELHVTVAFSRDLVDWAMIDQGDASLSVKGGPRTVEALGDKGAVVLKFRSKELQERWQEIVDLGASWDWPSYTPHVTITYQGGDVDPAGIEPYDGPLEFGPEQISEVVDDWEKSITEKAKPNSD